MKNLKKVMALVIVLSMVVSMFTVMTASAADFEDVIGTVYEEAVMTLAPMGVIAGYEEGETVLFKPEQVVTRAEMAAFIVRELGMAAAAKADKEIFTDVPRDFWGSGAIQVANKRNIVVGYGDGTFGPNDTVSFEAAVKMLVCALGYEEGAKDNGGWAVGYLIQADKLGLLEGLEEKLEGDTTAGCDRGTVALLLYNALPIPIQEVTYYNGQVLSKTKPGYTMTTQMGYEKWENVIVNATDTAAVSGSLQDKGYVALEGISKDVANGGWDMNAFLGRPVTVYVEKNNKANEYTIISVVGTTNESEIVTLDAADIYGMNGYDLEYYVDKATSSKTSDYTLAPLVADGGDLTMVYNNKAVSEDDQDYAFITEATNGIVTLIDSTKDGIFERVIIETYQNFQVVETDVEENMLYLQSAVDETEVELDDSKATNRPKFSIVDAEGTELALADLAEDDVLSIYSDVYPTSGKDYVKDADALKIVVCNDTIEGAVTSIANKKVYIDGEAYETDGVLSVNSFAIEDEGIFFLDFNGDIAFTDTTAVLDNFEFVYDGIVDGREITLYTMNSNGDKVSYEMATTVRVNGTPYNMSNADARNALAAALKIDGSNGLTEEYIVSLKTNESNEITRITLLDGTLEKNGYLSHSDKLLGSYSVNSDTVIFTLPKAAAEFDEDDLKAVKYNDLKNNSLYDYRVCDVDKNDVVTCMIVYTKDSKVKLDSSIAVIQSVATTKVDDEIVLSVTMIQEGKIVTKNTKTDDIFFAGTAFEEMYGESAAIAYGAYPGQIIMYATDAAGAITSADRVYPRPCLAEDYVDGYYLIDEFQTWDNTFVRNDFADLFLGAGFVSNKNTNTKVMTVDSAVEDTDASFVANYGSARIVVVDTNMVSDELAVKVGSQADIKAGDFVVVRKDEGSVKDIVVYKNFEAVPAFYK